jgi:hypothetical protein
MIAIMKSLLASCGLLMAAPIAAHPVGSLIPVEFHGLYARAPAACGDPNEIAFLRVSGDRLDYYEANEFLAMGIEFQGSTAKSLEAVPMFHGRFLVRSETQIGDIDLRLVMETPRILARYALLENGEVNEAEADRWFRCPE